MFQYAGFTVPLVALGASAYRDAGLLALIFSWSEFFFAIILTRWSDNAGLQPAVAS